MKKETIRTIFIILGVLFLLAVVGLGSAVWLFMSSFDHGKADASSAAQQFERVRSRFTGVTPVLALADGKPTLARQPAAQASGTRLATMHIMAWNAEDERIVRIDLPFWLLRLKSGPIEIASDTTWMGDDDLGITVEQLERYGPTLVLDHDGGRGDRVMIWTE